jgi:hypothetical protein
LRLDTGRSRMHFVLGSTLRRAGGVLNATRTAVVGHVMRIGDDASLHHCPINVGSVNNGLIHMHDRGVIGKVATAPLAAGKADAAVAVAVVHAAVVADVAAPIALMEAIVAVGPAPVVGRPQRAFIGSWNPGAGHPVVVSIVIGVGPIAGRPHQIGLRADRLHIDGQLRRSEADTDDDLRVRRDG